MGGKSIPESLMDQKRPIKVMSRSYGPEYSQSGKGSHIIDLNKWFAQCDANAFGNVIDRVIFFLHIGGSLESLFFEKPIKDGVRRRSIESTRVGVIDLGISKDTLTISDESYAEFLGELLMRSSDEFVEYVAKKRIEFDAEVFSSDVRTVIDRYRLAYARNR
jgi:hypothetical protein